MLRIFLLAIIVGAATPAIAAGPVPLKYRSYRNWKIDLPSSAWFKVNDGIRIVHAGGDRFAAMEKGGSLQFDTNGDGKFDRTIKPIVDRDSSVSTARVVLAGKTPAGEPFRYAVRLRKDAAGWGGSRQPLRQVKLSEFRLPANTGGWKWAPGGAMTGTIDSEAGPLQIRSIDQNGNGSFNDYGVDAMIVGPGDVATFLSSTILVDGELREISIASDGSQLTLSPYTGPVTKFDMRTAFNSKAVLLSAVIRSIDGRHSFDFGATSGPQQIPAATYQFVAGTVGLGQQRVQIGAGRMKLLKLEAGKNDSFEWGGPIRPEFTFTRAAGRVQFSPRTIWYYGKAGEEYFNWAPCGKSPEFKVSDADTGAVNGVAILPGSC